MEKLQKLSAELDEALLSRFRHEAEILAETILSSLTVQEDTEDACTALLACHAMLQQQKQDTERKQKTYQKELNSLSDNIYTLQKESVQMKQEVSNSRKELDILRIQLQDRSFRLLKLYMQNAQQEEELADLRGIPASSNDSAGMLALQLQLKELEAKKQIQLEQIHQLEHQKQILHQKIKKLKEDIISGAFPRQKHSFAVLSMQIFQDALQQNELEMQQVQTEIAKFDEQQEVLAEQIESAFAKNGDEKI